jgi:hypothetical protein
MSIVPINTLMCPISLQIFKCPVVIADGFTYEYEEIKNWLNNNNTSPMTKKIINNKTMIVNYLIKQQVDEYLLIHPEQIVHQYQYSIQPDVENQIINRTNNVENDCCCSWNWDKYLAISATILGVLMIVVIFLIQNP